MRPQITLALATTLEPAKLLVERQIQSKPMILLKQSLMMTSAKFENESAISMFLIRLLGRLPDNIIRLPFFRDLSLPKVCKMRDALHLEIRKKITTRLVIEYYSEIRHSRLL